MSEELKGLLIAEQENAYANIQRASTNFKKTSKGRLTRGYVKTRKETLEDYWSQFVTTNRSLIKHSKPEDKEKFDYFKDAIILHM